MNERHEAGDVLTVTVYAIALSIHVITAILGLGQAAGLGVVAASTPASGAAAPETQLALARLARGMSAASLLMLLSGALLEYASGGAFRSEWWLRISLVLLLALGGLAGATRRSLRKLGAASDSGALRRVARNAWAMCTLIAAAAILMELKPW